MIPFALLLLAAAPAQGAPQGLSRLIASLEAELGVRLVARISNNVVGLTPAGEALYEEAVRLVELERAARARVIQIGKETEVETQ